MQISKSIKIKTTSSFPKGFTMIELMVVLLVSSILAGFGFFFLYNSQPNLKLEGISRDLVTDLRYAQQMAISQQVKYGVRFSSDQKKYQIIQFSQTEQIIKTVYLPDGIGFQQINFTNSQVKFNIYGAVTEAGKVILNNQNSSTTIDIKPSGFVKMTK